MWTLNHPTQSDARHMWRIARDSGVLDLNSSYSYLLWCTDFSSTSAVARVDGDPIGFVSGYLRPSGSLMIWQVGVDEAYRGKGLAASMLAWLSDSLATLQGEPLIMETTVTQSNTASRALFAGFARRRDMELTESTGFGVDLFPDAHEAEPLLRLTPLKHLDHPKNSA
ncbi:diaminobutyrate acetyltransferase [Mycobacteroides immunogenum]|uniref:diaminobutyrate acetyltransferase n=1 Tax=Mycobacteroides immunogenum TaxID=83262 RepID=UPI0025B7466E|nr:diaminobutyrate acetyltransferase [Mycobacteroides immunogenum]WJR36360.1 diaminobutyrate acetyltransferase [Mycobacteroides immunogenum]